ncbi:MAG: hypothetical protein ACFCU4_06150 [Puniceicoccaceae bacterium]
MPSSPSADDLQDHPTFEKKYLWGIFRFHLRISPVNRQPEVLRRKLCIGRLLTIMVIVGLIAWASIGTALFGWYRIVRGHSWISYVDALVLPFKIENYRSKIGHSMIERGILLTEQGQYEKGFFHLRVGLKRNPQHLEGRSLLADYFMHALNDPIGAIDVLRKGIDGALQDTSDFRTRYLFQIFDLLETHQNDQEIFRIADLAFHSLTPSMLKQDVGFFAVRSLRSLGKFEAARAYLIENGLVTSPRGAFTLATIYQAEGREDQAFEILQNAILAFPEDSLLFDAYVLNLAERGQWRQVLFETNLRLSDFPSSRTPSLHRAKALHHLDRRLDRDQEINELLSRFPAEEILPDLALLASNLKDPELALSVLERAQVEGIDLSLYETALLETYLMTMDLPGIQASLNRLLPDLGGVESTPYLRGAVGLALVVSRSDVEAESFFRSFFEHPDAQVLEFRRLGHLAKQASQVHISRDIYLSGLTRFGNRNELIEGLLEIAIDQRQGEEVLRLLNLDPQGRLPAREYLSQAFKLLSKDRFLFLAHRDEALAKFHDILFPDGSALPESAEWLVPLRLRNEL